jgi:hypothetical protein
MSWSPEKLSDTFVKSGVVLTLKCTVVWDVTVCSLVEFDWCFGGTCYLCLQVIWVNYASNQQEASRALVNFYQIAQRHISEDSSPQSPLWAPPMQHSCSVIYQHLFNCKDYIRLSSNEMGRWRWMITKDTEGNDRGIYRDINPLLDWTTWGNSQNISLRIANNLVAVWSKFIPEHLY